MFRGTYTALVTPFRSGELDEDAFRAQIDEQADAGVQGIVPCGSTGESATMSHAEHEKAISIAIEQSAGRLKVIAGTGSNNTAEAIRLTSYAAEAGADAALLISPYYNKPTQKGHVAHYRAVAEAAGLPIIVYNIPGRTGVKMLPETLAEMSRIDNIVGVKDATGSLDDAQTTMALVEDGFCLLSGDDTLTLALIATGADGVIGVTPNLVPAEFKGMVDAALDNDIVTARARNRELLSLMQAMGLETNPIPVKTAMALMGKMGDEFRLPMTPMEPDNREKLVQVLNSYNLLPAS